MTDQYARSAKRYSRARSPHRAVVDFVRVQPYAPSMRVRDEILQKLTKAFAPTRLEVIDESRLHEGHAGHRPGGESHFRVNIVAHAFEGKSRIERHRMIHAVLARELEGGVHALAIEATAEHQAARATDRGSPDKRR